MSGSEVIFRKQGGVCYEVYRRSDNRYLGKVFVWFGRWAAYVTDIGPHLYLDSRRKAGEWLLHWTVTRENR